MFSFSSSRSSTRILHLLLQTSIATFFLSRPPLPTMAFVTPLPCFTTHMIRHQQQQQQQQQQQLRLGHTIGPIRILSPHESRRSTGSSSKTTQKRRRSSSSSLSTELNMVWWFGGTSSTEVTNTLDDESCELVPVLIEPTSPNSRRIMGEITIPCSIDDVWAVLTDYDNLSIHVPNLVESRRVSGGGVNFSKSLGTQGDGSYQCRLHQKGAQNIIGFEFGASVTMDMKEDVKYDKKSNAALPNNNNNNNSNTNDGEEEESTIMMACAGATERKIYFKCVDSQFFSEFDGEWNVQSTKNNNNNNNQETLLRYTVDVRPKGPVPVLALEWRIREDVPTNLRAVKKTSMDLGYTGIMKMRQDQQQQQQQKQQNGRRVRGLNGSRGSAGGALVRNNGRTSRNTGLLERTAQQQTVNTSLATTATTKKTKLQRVTVDWLEDETMAAYLKK